jgi:TatA/E family protein of Tat protein translocase
VFGLGVMEIVVIGAGLVLLFGARKIPLIARGLGEGIRNFKGEVGGRSTGSDKRPPALGDGEPSRPSEE